MQYNKRALQDAPKVPFNLDGRVMFSSEKIELVHLLLKPGEQVESHTQPFDVLFYVLEGTGKLKVGGDLLEAGKDTLVEVKAESQRGWTNSGNNALRLLVVKIFKS